VAATGQSGHFLSPHYGDLATFWCCGRYLPMSMNAGDYLPAAVGTLQLTPSDAS